MADDELDITAIAVGGDGIARDSGGRVVFVTGALPGERVRVTLTEERKDFARAEVAAVLQPSPQRRTPPCIHRREGCGGCGWMHVDPAAQHRLKVDMVADALARIAHHDPALVTAGGTVDPAARRTTIRLAVEDGRVGFRAAGSDRLVPVSACMAAHHLLDELLRLPMTGTGEVVLRCGARTGERLVDARGVRLANVPADVVLGARAGFHEIVHGTRLQVGARSFFQSSPEAAELLVDEVRRAIAAGLGTSPGTPVGRLVDAYGGVGLFAATIPAGRATIIESAPSSLADARRNVPRAKVIGSEVARWRPSPADVVVADPARTGLGRGATAALAGAGAPVLVLVSCDAASFARDVALLAGHGYRLREARVLDLFGDTPHVEVVSRFAGPTPVP